MNSETNNPIPVESQTRFNHKALVTAIQKGEFFKPCPGTTAGYLCCGYEILTPLTGCGMYCDYCILQAYFDHRCQVLYENFDDLQEEIDRKLSKRLGVVRIGTGEFADSLFQEGNLGLCKKIAALLEPYPNVIVEFKSKSANIDSLKDIKNPHKVIIGFSMNTPEMIALHEQDTASLKERLIALRRCEDMGFYIGIHFDPLLWHQGWEAGYRMVVRRIFDTVHNADRIAWWSMGGFRTNPKLKKMLRERNRHFPLFAQGEMILGHDGKYRYVRPMRVAFYKALQEEITAHYPPTPLYLCMESPEVWEESGMAHRIPQGLVRYLDNRAAVLLGGK